MPEPGRAVNRGVFPLASRRRRLLQFAGVALALTAAALPFASAAAANPYGEANTGSRIGGNVSTPGPYDHSLPFVDMMRQSNGFNLPDAPWGDPFVSTHGPIALNADGWPTEDFGTIIMGGWHGEPQIQGEYTIVFRGHATITPVASGGVTVGAAVTDAASGLTHVPLTLGPTATQLMLAFKNTGGSVRDLRVLRPGYRWDDPNVPVYTPEYRSYMAPFSTLRTMDWTATNTVTSGVWADRVTPHLTRGGHAPNRGPAAPSTSPKLPSAASWEQVITLGNELHKDLWINVPATADDDYVSHLAGLFRDQLDPSLKLYVEWGNEMWNGQFPQSTWLNDVATPAAIAAGNTHLGASSTNRYVQAQNYFAERTFQISAAFRGAFGDSAMMTRVRPVLAWQGGGHAVSDRMIAYAHSAMPDRPVNEYIWAFSGAPYFGLKATRNVDGLTMADLVPDITANVAALPKAFFYEYGAYLKIKYGIHWLAYEGGPDTFGPGSIPAKTELNRSSVMGDLCRTALTDWDRAGGELYMWYVAGAGDWTTQYGAWSTSETIDLLHPSTKMQCLNDVAASPSATPVARHISGIPFDAAETVNLYAVVGDPTWTNERKIWAKDQTKTYMVSSDQPVRTCYPFAVTAIFTNSAGRFTTSVNGQVQQTDRPISTTTGTTPVRTDLGEVCLEPGMNAVELKLSVAATGNLDQLIITDTGRPVPPPPAPTTPTPTTPAPTTPKPTTPAAGGTTSPTTPGSTTAGSASKVTIDLSDAARCVRGAGRIPLTLTVPKGAAVRSLTIGVSGHVVATIAQPVGGVVRLPASVTKALKAAKAKRPSLRAVVLMSDGSVAVRRLSPQLKGRTCSH